MSQLPDEFIEELRKVALTLSDVNVKKVLQKERKQNSNVADAIVITDNKARIQLVNPAYHEGLVAILTSR